MEKRYQIFISSTYKDLIEERRRVTQAILKMYHFPIGMEMFHADNEEQWVQIRNTIDMSDYYVLIMGRYCGTLTEDEGISYTEKEYDYALSKNIPVLSFVISESAKKESYGVETNKQQKAYNKFKRKVLKLPCEFWNNADELAFLVSNALNIKFKDRNRNGWVPYNPSGLTTAIEIDDFLVGSYDVYYYSVLKSRKEKRLIYSKLIIEPNGNVAFYNNTKNDLRWTEYIYHGTCVIEENIIYIYLKNDYSNERAMMALMKSVGNLHRFLGLFTALSSNTAPVCIKVACFKQGLNKAIAKDLLERILCSSNHNWDDDVLIVEEEEKYLFFSEEIFVD